MDTLRLMLLSLLIGVTVSTGTTYTNEDLNVRQAISVEGVAQASVQQSTPQVQVVYVTPAPTTKPATATAASGRRELARGCTGDDVRSAQRLLQNLGYNISVDGVFGTQMRNVVIQFQQNNGLKADGIIGPRTYRKLTSSTARGPGSGTQSRTTLSYGMTGQDVVELQARLKNLGYYYDLVSGNYLKNTRAAVTWFQLVNGLPQDGIAGPATLSRIYSSSAIPASSNPTPRPTYYPTQAPYPVVTRTLRQGMSGTDVGYVQQRLYDLGYLSIRPTDYFGEQTYWAVRTFQSYNGLYSDGVVGPATLSRLFSTSAVPYHGTTMTPGPIRPTPTPTPGPTAGPGQNKCNYCGTTFTNAQASLHNPAVCGRHCVSQTQYNHDSATCGKSGHNWCDGRDHSTASCLDPWHFKCDSLNHAAASCGQSGHYNCDGYSSHDVLKCGQRGYNHFACVADANDAAHKMQCTNCGGWKCYVDGLTCASSLGGSHNFVSR